MASAIEQAIRQICEEKGLSYESVMETIEAAMAAAYRKDYGNMDQNLETKFDPATAGIEVWDVKTVIENIDPEDLVKADEARRLAGEDRQKQMDAMKARGEVIPPEMEMPVEVEGPKFNPKTEIMVSDAQVMKLGSKVGDILRIALPVPGEFGRMAAMTAKQVITQKLREAEREILFSEFKEHEHEVMIGTVQRREGRIVLVDLGRITGVIKPEDQIATERYNPNDRLKVFVKSVMLTTRGPQVLLSRTADELVKHLFSTEIPEVADGTVQIKALARDPGSRSKVAVFTRDSNVDPIGACIGQRGTRIQTIIAELGGEKIDIIEWNDNVKQFIINSLSPAKVQSVELNETEKLAIVTVAVDQLSLAIGRGGQNVRLAARLVGWKINVAEIGGKPVETVVEPPVEPPAA